MKVSKQGNMVVTNRIFGLDIIRAVAIIFVVLSHGAFMLEGTVIEGFPFFKMIDGVELFFVLSGFLIGGILLKMIDQPEIFGYRQLKLFWKRRWLRTLPNYYLILLVNYIFVSYGVINEDITRFGYRFFLFLQNFNTPLVGFFWESWSLSIEEWFYLITPLLILIFIQRIKVKWAYLFASVIMILFSAVYRFSIYNSAVDPFWWDVIYRKIVLCRLDSIGYGLLAAWIFYYYTQRWKQFKIYAAVIGIAIMIFILNWQVPVTTYYSQVIYFSLAPIAIMFLLPIAESIRRGPRYIVGPITHISKISYSMYLINLALVAEVIRDNFAPQGGWDGIVKYILYWIIVIGVSTLLYRYFEKPIMDLRDKKIQISH